MRRPSATRPRRRCVLTVRAAAAGRTVSARRATGRDRSRRRSAAADRLVRPASRRAPPARRSSCAPGMTSFDQRIALVTGASGGIGRRIAERPAGSGARVALHYGSRAQAAEELAAALPGAAAFGADMRDPHAPDRLIDAVESELGPIDVLVANHGLSRPARFEQVDAAAFDETLAVNLRAPFLLARRVLPGMSARGYGRVLFLSSVAGFTGGVVGPHYAASKAGLHGITHFLARRVAADGVTVNALAPALIADTGMLPGPAGELARRIPVGRLGRPEEVADLVAAVVRNGYLTNQVLSVDGGLHPR